MKKVLPGNQHQKGHKGYHVPKVVELNGFMLESGYTFPFVDVAYETYGKLNAERSNTILVCHALTGNSHASDFNNHAQGLLSRHNGWWDSLIGPGKGLDTNKYFIVCSNILGSCYGTTGPSSINPQSGKGYAASFPEITVRDMVSLQKRLLDHLDISVLKLVIGGSLGGMQALEWGLLFPEKVERLLTIATSAQHSAWAIGLNQAARLAIKNDPAWAGGNYKSQPAKGFGLARIIAMLSYRSFQSYQQAHGRNVYQSGSGENGLALFKESPPTFEMERYLHYQAEKITQRFDANSYITISNAMDNHNVARNRGKLNEVLSKYKAKTICMGINSDLLYPAQEQKELAALIPNAQYHEIKSHHGHDAFLIEHEQVARSVREILGDK